MITWDKILILTLKFWNFLFSLFFLTLSLDMFLYQPPPFFWEREWAQVRARERENLQQAGHRAWCGAWSHNPEIMTWAEIKSQALNQLNHPGAPCINLLLKRKTLRGTWVAQSVMIPGSFDWAPCRAPCSVGSLLLPLLLAFTLYLCLSLK